ncbi:hypothetical protein ES703_73487 [subsurface metagenome]
MIDDGELPVSSFSQAATGGLPVPTGPRPSKAAPPYGRRGPVNCPPGQVDSGNFPAWPGLLSRTRGGGPLLWSARSALGGMELILSIHYP